MHSKNSYGAQNHSIENCCSSKWFVNCERQCRQVFSFGLAVVQVHPDGPSRAKTCEYEG